MSPAPKQSATSGSGQSAAGDAPEEIEEALKRIRELNEQILQQGREWGLGFLDAYEKTLTTFADYQTKAADAVGVDWVADVARAQADFLRKVTDAYTSSARQILK